jgi:cytoskeletal protein CcmA (bactofilin family)
MPVAWKENGWQEYGQEVRKMFGIWNGKETSGNYLGKGLRIVGDVLGAGSFVCDGDVEGKIELDGLLRIASHGKVRGCVEARDAEIAGEVEGDVITRGRLTLRSTCRLKGDVVAAEIEVEPGASVQGRIQIVRQNGQPALDSQETETVASSVAFL